jgi:hypothetical protein
VFASSTVSSRPQGRFSDVGEDLGSAFMGAGRDLNQRAGNILDGFRAKARGEQTALETGAQMAGNILGGAGDLAFRGAQAVVTPFMKESEERAVESGFNRAIDATGLPEAMQNASPRAQRNVIGGLGLFEGVTAGAGTFASQPVTRGFQGVVNRVLGRGSQAVPSPTQTVEQVVDTATRQLQRQANDPNLPPRAKEEAANAAMSFKERYIGLTPDVKARLQEMGPQKLQEYLDAVHLRNIDDTAPTPYEVGSRSVQTAQERLEEALRNTGSGIGQTRQKLATYRFQQPQMEKIERIFNGELNRLKLTVKNGEITQPAGTISPANAGDVIALNNLYKDFLTFKQSPTLENAIALRTNLDGKIKFGKSSRDVSNEVDPLSRSVRATIAQEAAKVVGKENAAELQKYSDFMDAYGDMKSYTDRAAGGEYLLRLVLSGRGGDARQLIQTVKEYTGLDLMNDATAMKVATELLGNQNTQNLFKQEVTRAGYDVASVLTGGPTGLIETAAKRLLDFGIDPENILKAAAAGTGGYVLLTYSDENGLTPAGLAVLGALPLATRLNMLDEAMRYNLERRAAFLKAGKPENSPEIRALEKQNTALAKEKAKLQDGATE